MCISLWNKHTECYGCFTRAIAFYILHALITYSNFNFQGLYFFLVNIFYSKFENHLTEFICTHLSVHSLLEKIPIISLRQPLKLLLGLFDKLQSMIHVVLEQYQGLVTLKLIFIIYKDGFECVIRFYTLIICLICFCTSETNTIPSFGVCSSKGVLSRS